MITTRIKDAPLVWNHLNGIINAFKPAGMKSKHVKYAIIGNITKDLNEMQVREPRKMLRIDGNDATKYSVTMQTDLSDHVLATGPRYQIEDTKCNISMQLGENTSGLLCTIFHA